MIYIIEQASIVWCSYVSADRNLNHSLHVWCPWRCTEQNSLSCQAPCVNEILFSWQDEALLSLFPPPPPHLMNSSLGWMWISLVLLCLLSCALLRTHFQPSLLILSVDAIILSANVFNYHFSFPIKSRQHTYPRIVVYRRHGEVWMTTHSWRTHLSGISLLSCNIAWQENHEQGEVAGRAQCKNGSVNTVTDKESEWIQPTW